MAQHNSTADLVFTHGRGGNLYLGPLPAAQSNEYLESIACSCVITALSEPPDALHGVQRHHVKIADSNEAHMTPHFAAAVLQIERWLAAGVHVLVHCSSGISRSSTVVLAYLIVAQGRSLCTAYQEVKSARPCIQPGTMFFSDLQQLEMSGNGGCEAPSMSLAQYYGYTVQYIVVHLSGGKADYNACVAAAERFGWQTDFALMQAGQYLLVPDVIEICENEPAAVLDAHNNAAALGAHLWCEVLCRLDGASLVRTAGINTQLCKLAPSVRPLEGFGLLRLPSHHHLSLPLLSSHCGLPVVTSPCSSLQVAGISAIERSTDGIMPLQAQRAWPWLEVLYGPEVNEGTSTDFPLIEDTLYDLEVNEGTDYTSIRDTRLLSFGPIPYCCSPQEVAILASAELLNLQRVTEIPSLQLACGLGRPDLASALVRAGCDPSAGNDPTNTDYSSPAWLRHFNEGREKAFWFEFLDHVDQFGGAGFAGTAIEVADRHGHAKTSAAVKWAATLTRPR